MPDSIIHKLLVCALYDRGLLKIKELTGLKIYRKLDLPLVHVNIQDFELFLREDEVKFFSPRTGCTQEKI